MDVRCHRRLVASLDFDRRRATQLPEHVGARSRRLTANGLRHTPLIVTDGFDFYEMAVRRAFGPAALYAQVIKTRRHDRVVKVERRARLGAAWRFDDALNNSEDSSTLNTSSIERLNLTIR